jgi:hypothetical protein
MRQLADPIRWFTTMSEQIHEVDFTLLPDHHFIAAESFSNQLDLTLVVHVKPPEDTSFRLRHNGYYTNDHPFMESFCNGCENLMMCAPWRHVSAGEPATIDSAFNVQTGEGRQCMSAHSLETLINMRSGDSMPLRTYHPAAPGLFTIISPINRLAIGHYTSAWIRLANAALDSVKGHVAIGPTRRAFNTYGNGGPCWGNRRPEFAQLTHHFFDATANLDLCGIETLEDYRSTLRENAARILSDPKQTIPFSRLLSVNNEASGLLMVDNELHHEAFTLLSATGLKPGTFCPENNRTILLPVMRHCIEIEGTTFAGFITPILPAINRCWFLQQTATGTAALLGQVDPPST